MPPRSSASRKSSPSSIRASSASGSATSSERRSRMRNGNVAFLALVTLLSAGPAFAQGAAGSTGTIQGQVVDESFAALPGVAITATGTAMLGAQTTTSGPEGNYRF